jgi:hypothetical protein
MTGLALFILGLVIGCVGTFIVCERASSPRPPDFEGHE